MLRDLDRTERLVWDSYLLVLVLKRLLSCCCVKEKRFSMSLDEVHTPRGNMLPASLYRATQVYYKNVRRKLCSNENRSMFLKNE